MQHSTSSHRVVKDGKLLNSLFFSTDFTESQNVQRHSRLEWLGDTIYTSGLACGLGGAYAHMHLSEESSPSIPRVPRGSWLQRSEEPQTKPSSLISQKWKRVSKVGSRSKALSLPNTSQPPRKAAISLNSALQLAPPLRLSTPARHCPGRESSLCLPWPCC